MQYIEHDARWDSLSDKEHQSEIPLTFCNMYVQDSVFSNSKLRIWENELHQQFLKYSITILPTFLEIYVATIQKILSSNDYIYVLSLKWECVYLCTDVLPTQNDSGFKDNGQTHSSFRISLSNSIVFVIIKKIYMMNKNVKDRENIN
jgi:hypothetical protein